MKKKITTVALVFLAFGTSMKVTAQSSEMKHFTIGLGGAFDADVEAITQNTKFDFNISPKFSVGIKNNLRLWDKTNTQVNKPDDVGVQTTYNWRNTVYNNASIVGSYSILGSNQNDKKFNLNVFAGLGLRYDVYKWNQENTNVPSNYYYADRSSDKTTTFLVNTGVGVSYKLGPGKIYVEIPVFIDLQKKYTYSVEYDKAPSLNSESSWTYKLSDSKPGNTNLSTIIGFNFGYQINF